MQEVPWTGRVVDVIDGIVYLNAGTETGLTPGDTLHVSTATQDLVDPETGLHLGVLEKARGTVGCGRTLCSGSPGRRWTVAAG